MEDNASNALLMAGGVLISVIIITIGVVIFQASAQFARNYEVEREQIELASFNSQFEKYDKKKGGLTLHDIIAVANLAREINNVNNIPLTFDTYKNSHAIRITLKVDGNEKNMESLQNREARTDEEKISDLIFILEDDSLRMNGSEIQEYKCTDIHYSTNSGKVDRMIFEKNN